MPKYYVRYSAFITMEVEGETDQEACETADLVLLEMTGADFRECTEFEEVEQVEEIKE